MVMYCSLASWLLVGSKSTQPMPGINTDIHAWDASTPVSFSFPAGASVSKIAAHISCRQIPWNEYRK